MLSHEPILMYYAHLSACRLVCPVCGKDKYGNILGLSNHCRIMHDLRFVTPEERIEKCGVPVVRDQDHCHCHYHCNCDDDDDVLSCLSEHLAVGQSFITHDID